MRRSKSPDFKSPKQKSPERRTSNTTVTIESKRSTKSPEKITRTSENKSNKTTKTESKYFHELKKVPETAKTPREDDKPEWITRSSLKKVKYFFYLIFLCSEFDFFCILENKKFVSSIFFKVTDIGSPIRKSSSTTVTTKKESVFRSKSPCKEKITDVITSSYGVGPTDENGTPLFGLRALRAKNTSESSKGE